MHRDRETLAAEHMNICQHCKKKKRYEEFRPVNLKQWLTGARTEHKWGFYECLCPQCSADVLVPCNALINFFGGDAQALINMATASSSAQGTTDDTTITPTTVESTTHELTIDSTIDLSSDLKNNMSGINLSGINGNIDTNSHEKTPWLITSRPTTR